MADDPYLRLDKAHSDDDLSDLETEDASTIDISDSTPLRRSEVWAWYCQHISNIGLGSSQLAPMLIQDMASAAGFEASDHSKPCDTSVKPYQCATPIFGNRYYLEPGTISLYISSITAITVLLVTVSIAAIADHSQYRKNLLMVFSTLGSIVALCFFTIYKPSLFWIGAILLPLVYVFYTTSNILCNAFLPFYGRNHPSVLTARSNKESLGVIRKIQEQAVNDIASHSAVLSNIATLVVYSVTIAISVALDESSLSLQIGIAFLGIWWLVWAWGSSPWLLARSGPPVPKGTNLLVYSWKSASINQLPEIAKFLIAWFFLSDGVHTTFSIKGVVLYREIGFSHTESILTSVFSHGTGAIGTYLLMVLRKRWMLSTKTMIYISLTTFAISQFYAVVASCFTSQFGLRQKWEGWTFALILGLVNSTFWTSCQVTISELCPSGHENEWQSIFSLSDRAGACLYQAFVKMPVSIASPSVLPPAMILRLQTLEDRIAYKYSQDRIDQGLDQDGNELPDHPSNHYSQNDDEDEQVSLQWLLKLLVKLETSAPPEEEESSDENDQDQDLDSDSNNEHDLDNPDLQSMHHHHRYIAQPASYTSKVTAKVCKETPQEAEYRKEHGVITERVSSLVAHFCGRAASGAMTRTWNFKTEPPRSLQIHDPSFTGGDVGFKTFGSAYLLSKHITHGDIPQLQPWTPATSSETQNAASSTTTHLPKILELGSGTGLVGFTATLYSNPFGPKVILSDYHPNVLSTLAHNSSLNGLDSRCDIQMLDWRNVLERRRQHCSRWREYYAQTDAHTQHPDRATEYDNVIVEKTAGLALTDDAPEESSELMEEDRMDLILGAEVVYDPGHAELVAHMVDEYLKRDWIRPSNEQGDSKEQHCHRPAFHIMFPLRETHTDVIAEFDFWMDQMGLVDCRQHCEWGREDGETKFLYHWREYVRKEHL
ncbi:Autophagy protein 22 [Lunasporangiospora selenospora]|uniref:Autophagy-related protein n=1 Tax=Lunasporangiospora selenospora TaxID=979761 RepID=A0A9P6G1Q0_9FUNG|nr:Autophagy protein 22 [Lunasporangiospora selenospora]